MLKKERVMPTGKKGRPRKAKTQILDTGTGEPVACLTGDEEFPYTKNLCHYDPFITRGSPINKKGKQDRVVKDLLGRDIENIENCNIYDIENAEGDLAVEVSSPRGLPKERDMKLWFRFLALAYKNKSAILTFDNIEQLRKALRIKDDPKEIILSFIRLASVTIAFRRSFYDKKKKKKVSVILHLLDLGFDEDILKDHVKHEEYQPVMICLSNAFFKLTKFLGDASSIGYCIWISLAEFSELKGLLEVKSYLWLKSFPNMTSYREDILKLSRRRAMKVGKDWKGSTYTPSVIRWYHDKVLNSAWGVIRDSAIEGDCSRWIVKLAKKGKGNYDLIFRKVGGFYEDN